MPDEIRTPSLPDRWRLTDAKRLGDLGGGWGLVHGTAQGYYAILDGHYVETPNGERAHPTMEAAIAAVDLEWQKRQGNDA